MNAPRNPRELQSVYTVGQGRGIFNLPPWTGSKSHARRMQPGDLLVHDAWYFVPLIAWYAGIRRDEICGLDVNDVETEDGFWLFNVLSNDVCRVQSCLLYPLDAAADLRLVMLGICCYTQT